MELNDKWIIWSHELNDSNWENDSYKKIFEEMRMSRFSSEKIYY